MTKCCTTVSFSCSSISLRHFHELVDDDVSVVLVQQQLCVSFWNLQLCGGGGQMTRIVPMDNRLRN